MKKDIAIIVPFFNPFKSQYLLLNVFRTLYQLASDSKSVFVVEVKYTDKSLNQNTLEKVTEKHKFKYIQLKCRDILFHKERMVNIVAKNLLGKYKTIAYIDADIIFDFAAWKKQVINSMENFDLVQCFGGDCIRYVEKTEIRKVNSVMYNFIKRNIVAGSPGGTWAGNEKFWSIGLFDKMILGPNDSFLIESITNDENNPNYFYFKNVKISYNFNYDFFKYKNEIKKLNIGYVDEKVSFQYHYKKNKKKYGERMLMMEGFDPSELVVNEDGLYEWKDPSSKRAGLLKNYFRNVNS